MTTSSSSPAQPSPPPHGGPDAEAFVRTQSSPEFTELRRSFRSFAFPLTAAFLVWYLLYVLLSTYAEAFMAQRVVGYVTVGLLISIGQFVTTFGITYAYVRHANRSIDPKAAAIRDELEGAS